MKMAFMESTSSKEKSIIKIANLK